MPTPLTISQRSRWTWFASKLIKECIIMKFMPNIVHHGAMTTATHGSGRTLGNLTSALLGASYVAADGALRHAGETDAELQLVLLGCLGVLVEVELRVEPSYSISQQVYLRLPWGTAESHFEELMGLAYSVSLFTDWSESDGVSQVHMRK